MYDKQRDKQEGNICFSSPHTIISQPKSDHEKYPTMFFSRLQKPFDQRKKFVAIDFSQ